MTELVLEDSYKVYPLPTVLWLLLYQSGNVLMRIVGIHLGLGVCAMHVTDCRHTNIHMMLIVDLSTSRQWGVRATVECGFKLKGTT
jgi:hypothetical protein